MNQPTKYRELHEIIGHLHINGKPAVLATKKEMAQVIAKQHAKIKSLNEQVKTTRETGISLLKDFNKHKNS